jgi:hypothetical protein
MTFWDGLRQRFVRLTPEAWRSNPYAKAYYALDEGTRRAVWRVLGIDGVLDYTTAAAILKADAIEPIFRYRHFTLPKSDGRLRQIAAPDDGLKTVQRTLLRRVLELHQPHATALGFRRKKSIADHARKHAGAALFIVADLEDFFPNTAAWRVAAWWRDALHDFDSDDATRLFTLLTTHRGGLPQGAPTSPALSNLVNIPLDEALNRRAVASGGRYSRYCDDLVFSWPDGAGPPSDFEVAVRAVLGEHSYQLNPAKGWEVYTRADEPVITGVVMKRDGRVVVPDSIHQEMRALRRLRDPEAAQRLRGYEGYQQMIERPRRARRRR